MNRSAPPTTNASQSVRVKLIVDTKAPGTARALATAALSDWELDGMAADVKVCVSELVTNALVKKATQIHLRMERLTLRMVEIAVWDDAQGVPVVQPLDETAEGGRGLPIVDALSAVWWVQGSPSGGKTVRARFINENTPCPRLPAGPDGSKGA